MSVTHGPALGVGVSWNVASGVWEETGDAVKSVTIAQNAIPVRTSLASLHLAEVGIERLKIALLLLGVPQVRQSTVILGALRDGCLFRAKFMTTDD